ncbi:hypothetical protein B0H34DRAFT_257269 [Crassisporium funariophilum]|nr:hypothetical protein B0H34DRAFT_257269 [Crassisporium funariophilum]
MSSPPAKPRWSSRMGNVMRRTSSVLAISRPTTPSIASDRDADAMSLNGGRTSGEGVKPQTPAALPALSPPEPSKVTTSPSPIAESPMREAEATKAEVVGPSPLAQGTEEASKQEEAPVTADEVQTSPTGYIPPPLLDSTIGNPGAFTDDPDELPQPDVARDPYATPPHRVDEVDTDAEVKTEDTHAEEHQRSVEPVEAEAPRHEDDIFAPSLKATSSYFDKPIVESLKDSDSVHQHSQSHEHADHPSPAAVEAVQQNASVIDEQEEEAEYGHGAAAEYYKGDSGSAAAKEVEDTKPAPVPEMSYELPAYSGQEVWGGVGASHEDDKHAFAQQLERQYREDTGMGAAPDPLPIAMPSPSRGADDHGLHGFHEEHGYGIEHHQQEHREESRAPSVRAMPYADPFADPVAPRITVSHSDAPHVYSHTQMPSAEISEQHHQMPLETHEDAHGAIVMPLPAFHEVAGRRSAGGFSTQVERETD